MVQCTFFSDLDELQRPSHVSRLGTGADGRPVRDDVHFHAAAPHLIGQGGRVIRVSRRRKPLHGIGKKETKGKTSNGVVKR